MLINLNIFSIVFWFDIFKSLFFCCVSKQIEKRYPDGSTEIQFPDQTLKNILPDGSEKTTFADGTTQKVDCNGVRVIIFPNGQKETHTKQFKVGLDSYFFVH